MNKSKISLRSRRWCFTLNNPKNTELAELSTLSALLESDEHDIVKFLIWQEEEGDEQTNHVQGYFETHTRRTFKSLKKLLSFLERAHLERARGSQQQNISYCSKQDCISGFTFISGNRQEQGKRTDLTKFKELIDSKQITSMQDCYDSSFNIFMKYNKAAKIAIELNVEKRRWEMQIRVFIGKTNTGKTYLAHKLAGEKTYTLQLTSQKQNKVWWDNYQGESAVIIDEFTGQIPYTYLLKLLDRYPMKVEYKGGITEFRSKWIFITSNLSPREWYPSKVDMTPLLRRLNSLNCKICDFTGPLLFEKKGSKFVPRPKWTERERDRTWDPKIIKKHKKILIDEEDSSSSSDEGESNKLIREEAKLPSNDAQKSDDDLTEESMEKYALTPKKSKEKDFFDEDPLIDEESSTEIDKSD